MRIKSELFKNKFQMPPESKFDVTFTLETGPLSSQVLFNRCQGTFVDLTFFLQNKISFAKRKHFILKNVTFFFSFRQIFGLSFMSSFPRCCTPFLPSHQHAYKIQDRFLTVSEVVKKKIRTDSLLVK